MKKTVMGFVVLVMVLGLVCSAMAENLVPPMTRIYMKMLTLDLGFTGGGVKEMASGGCRIFYTNEENTAAAVFDTDDCGVIQTAAIAVCNGQTLNSKLVGEWIGATYVVINGTPEGVVEDLTPKVLKAVKKGVNTTFTVNNAKLIFSYFENGRETVEIRRK